MSGVNKVILIGHLGGDPEIKTVNNNKVATIKLATSEKYKNKEGSIVENTEWHNLTLWNGLADVAEKYLHKGDKIYAEGKIKYRQSEKDGVKRYFTEIVVESIQMLSGKKSSESEVKDTPRSEGLSPVSNDLSF